VAAGFEAASVEAGADNFTVAEGTTSAVAPVIGMAAADGVAGADGVQAASAKMSRNSKEIIRLWFMEYLLKVDWFYLYFACRGFRTNGLAWTNRDS
jgi:hypothetical protein